MPKGVYKRKPGVKRPNAKLSKCVRGHDTTLPENRHKDGGCKICRINDREKWCIKPTGVLYKRRNSLKGSGWTPELFDKVLEEQNNLCALCKKPFEDSNRPRADHDHESMMPRGILHNNCNVAIGFFEDNPELCRMGAEYLEFWYHEQEIKEAQSLMGRLGLPKENTDVSN